MLKKMGFVCAIVGITLSGCGKASEDARLDTSEQLDARTPVSKKSLAARVQLLDDLLDQELATAHDDHERRLRFFKKVVPAVAETELEVEAERDEVLAYQTATNQGITVSALLAADMAIIFQRYKTEKVNELLARVDDVPLDLLFSQAAIESASGESAVARDCHNIFGVHAVDRAQSCAGHSVLAAYLDFTGSIKRYVLLLNSGPAFASFRVLRQKNRARVGPMAALDSSAIVEGLLPYSTRGEAYVRQVEANLKADHLDQLYRNFIHKL
jgi:Bax protein